VEYKRATILLMVENVYDNCRKDDLRRLHFGVFLF